jgi:hypothetical protein
MSFGWSIMKFLEDFVGILFLEASEENSIIVPSEKDIMD